MAGMDFSRFDGGALHETQRARLGIEYQDLNGERWGYIRVREAMSFGEIVRSSKGAELGAADPVIVTGASAVGTSRLITTNGFVVSNKTVDLRGALGSISAGGGIYQQFYILSNDDDEAKVFVVTGNTNRNQNQGWVTALTTASRVQLIFPGEGRQGDAVTDNIDGIMQVDAGENDLGKFCWVKRSGMTPVLIDSSGTNDIGAGDIVVVSAAGLATGAFAATPTAANAAAAIRGAIGRAVHASARSGDTDYLAEVDLDIRTGPLSYCYADIANGYNEVSIR